MTPLHRGRPTASRPDRPTPAHRRSTEPPPVGDAPVIDVRPGAAASFDGDRVRLTLWVVGGGRRSRVPWARLAELEATVTAELGRGPATVVRFGDRAACRAALGPAGVAAVERRLAAAARAAGARLVTWSGDPPSRDGRWADRGD